MRSEDCLVEVSMSQGYSATIATMPDGPHAFRIDQDPDVDTTHVCVLNGVKGKLTKDYCCATRLATACTGKTSVTYTFEPPSASK